MSKGSVTNSCRWNASGFGHTPAQDAEAECAGVFIARGRGAKRHASIAVIRTRPAVQRVPMARHFALVLLMTPLLSGCIVGVPGHLYPVHGPLSAETPAPVYSVRFSGIWKSGTMSATLQDGEVCSGSWAAVPQDDPSANRMAAEWDSVYGSGFFVANVLGKPVFARATLSGTKGTTLSVELYDSTPGTMASAEGVAKDNKGNIFKLTF